MKQRERLNCPNCGQPITGIRCEYCGTVFYDMADIDISKENYIRIRIGDKITTFKCIVSNISMTHIRYESSILDVQFIITQNEPGIYTHEYCKNLKSG